MKLREAYQQYQEVKQKGQINLKRQATIGSLENQQYFYRPKNSIFLQHPDNQIQFFQTINNVLESDIKPQKCQYLSEQIARKVRKLEIQQYTNLKEQIIQRFKQRIDDLKLRKLKIISRNPIEDQYYKSRFQMIDLEIISLQNRIQRIKLDEQYIGVLQQPQPTKLYQTQKQTFQHSNIKLDDLQIFLRGFQWESKLKRPFNALFSKITFNYDILDIQTEILSDLALKNSDQNNQYYNNLFNFFEDKLFEITIEKKQKFYDILKTLQFNVFDKSVIQQLGQRYDRVPLIIINKQQCQILFNQSYQLYLNPITDQSKQQKLIYLMNNFCNMIEGFQKYISFWEFHEKTEYHLGGLQKLIIELSTFDDSQEIKEYLKEQYPINSDEIKLKKDDWSELLQIDLVKDQYQQYMELMLQTTTIDWQTQKIVQLLRLTETQELKIYIQQIVQDIRKNTNLIFNIADNHPYIEFTRKSLRLSQINELFDINQSQTFLSCRSKLKSEFLSNLTQIIEDNLPEENMLNAIYNLIVCKIRDYKRKILYYLNAQLSIQRKLAFDLLNIRKAKIPKDIDTQFLIRLREEKLKSQEFEQIDRKSYLSFVKPEPLKLSKFQSQLNKKAKLCKRLPKITYNNDILPDVQVTMSKRIVLYDKAQIYLQKVLDRIVQYVSLYINKYEKLTVILKQPQLIDRFQCILDCFEYECRFQFKKLQLLEHLFKIYEYTGDPLSNYEILEHIFLQIEEIPLLDVENFYFIDSYTLHIDILQQKINILERLMAQSEKIENNFIQIQFRNYSNYKQRTDPPQKQEEEQILTKPVDSNYDQYMIGNKMQQIFEELNYKRSTEQIPQQVESRNEIDKNLIMMPHFNYNSSLTFYDSFKNIIKIFKKVEDRRDNMMIQTKSMNSYLSLTLACYKHTFKEIYLKPIYDQEPINEFNLLEDVLKMNIPIQFHTLNNLENIKFEKDIELTELEICQQYLEFTNLKEKHITILAKTKSAHKIYKKLKGVEKMAKYKELYNCTTSTKKKNMLGNFQFDIDENFEFPEYNAMRDSVEEYRLIVMYDKMNLYYLRMNNLILQNNLSESLLDEQDLKGWQQFRFLREDSKFMKKDQISREFGDKGMLMDIQRNIAIQRQSHQNLKFRKSDFIRIYNSKLKEKNFTSQSNKQIDLVITQKKQHIFKCFLQKQLIYDMLQDCMLMANINQKFQLQKQTKRLINIMPTKVKLKQMQHFDLNKLEINSIYLQPFNSQAQITEFYSNYLRQKSIFFRNQYFPDQLKQYQKNDDLRYHLQLHRYLLLLIQNSALLLEQNELTHMSELFLFHMDFNSIDVTQELYFQNSNEFVSNPLKALLNYDFLKSENKQSQKNIVVSKAIDEIIEKIKNYHSIRYVFDQHLQSLKIEEDFKENERCLKLNSKQIFLNTYNSLIIANNVINREQPNDHFEKKLEIIKQYNFLSHRCSFVNLKQFQSKFLCNNKVSWFKIDKDRFHSNIIEFINSIPNNQKQKDFNQMCYPYNKTIDSFQGILLFSRITDKERVIIAKSANEQQKLTDYNYMDLYFKLQDFSRQTQNQERIKLKESNIKEILNEYLVDHSIQVMHKEIQMIGSAAEELPLYEDKQKLQKQVVSQVIMPRVKFIQTFHSTQTNVPASLKVSFIQSFLNRLKNKASLVELLSSGLGYVISSLDLEDSLNMLNRELFNFSERELEIRQETFNHLFDLLNHEIKNQQKEIKQLKQENDHLKQTFQQRLISLTIAKSNNILFELEGLKQKHKEYKFYTQNLEDRIREEIEHDKRLQIDELTFQLDTVQKKFDQFREGLVTICKQEVQNKQKMILQFIQDKTSDILLDQKRSNYHYQEVPSQPNDPYQYVIRINQMRKEHSEQLAAMKQDYDQKLINFEKLERQYKTLKDEVQECKRIENTLKIEVINSQQTINQLNKQKDKLIEENENLLFEKKRLFKHLDDLQQKFKSLDTKTVEIKRRNAISVEHSRTVKASEQIKVTLPKLQIK